MTEETCVVGPERVVAAYRKIGLRAVQGDYFVYGGGGNENCCCGLSAVILADTPTPLWWVAIPQLSAGHLEQYLSGVGEWWVGGFCTRGNTVANYCS
jgi:hypothetical protein